MALTGRGSQLEQETVNARIEASQQTIEELTAKLERFEDEIKAVLQSSSVTNDDKANTERLKWARGILEDTIKEQA